MSKEIMQESTQIVECNAFHRGMSVLEANLRNTEDSESTISVPSKRCRRVLRRIQSICRRSRLGARNWRHHI